ncbi:hypothetical protein T12_11673 [Trichinella patagoniensis]|uniref:Uncharacterized protein n=1 Tax=Trichinella patagoniensis TaxID=990121 RepID=A0A0V0Z3S8_9BILA|nr:hypothetical protein T12_11673 [Trichinella patagoniensis]
MFPAYNVFPLSTSVFSGPQMNESGLLNLCEGQSLNGCSCSAESFPGTAEDIEDSLIRLGTAV